ncbi:hypothetical protein PINS_up003695 [Pythium insidiosum]|nr:hypothetical protein PINS_up003695 [Pythium insidiosum]
MVVLKHDRLHDVLWGASSRSGRSARSDVIVYIQLLLVASLTIWQFVVVYEKPAAARLAATGAALLLYFRSVDLFVRLIVVLSCLTIYGDVFVPARRLLKAGATTPTDVVPVLLYALLVVNNLKVLFVTFRASRRATRKAKELRQQHLKNFVAAQKAKVA